MVMLATTSIQSQGIGVGVGDSGTRVEVGGTGVDVAVISAGGAGVPGVMFCEIWVS